MTDFTFQSKTLRTRVIWPDGPVPPVADLTSVDVSLLYDGTAITTSAQRNMAITFTAAGLSAVAITTQPAQGYAIVNPNLTIALVLTLSTYTGALSMVVDVTHSGGTTELTLNFDVTASRQFGGHVTGRGFYTLPVDGSGRYVPTAHAGTRKVHISPTGMDAAAVATDAGVTEGEVTPAWLIATGTAYGTTELLALAPTLGLSLWSALFPTSTTASHWLLLERGGTYDIGTRFPRGAKGQSPIEPIVIGAWGAGTKPILSGTQQFYMFQDASENVLFQDLDMRDGVFFLEGAERNSTVAFDNCTIVGAESAFQGQNALTLRNCLIRDVWRDAPVDAGLDFWDAYRNRISGIYITKSNDFLLDGVIFDLCGWEPGFATDGSTASPHPPSQFSHNLYANNTAVSNLIRDSVSVRAASMGLMYRGGAVLVDTLMADNNLALSALSGEQAGWATPSPDPIATYSVKIGCVTTQAAARSPGVPSIGALDWALQSDAIDFVEVSGIIAHANDPDDVADTQAGQNVLPFLVTRPPLLNEPVVWRWGNTDSAGVNATEANATTIQLYAQELLADVDATQDDLYAYWRTLPSEEYRDAAKAVNAWFRTGFSVPWATHTATTLDFVPDPYTDGVAWFNPRNWRLNSDGEPSGVPIDGDTLNLRGATVIVFDTFDGTINLGGGTLIIVGGLISGTITGPGVVQLEKAGQTDATIGGGATTNDLR